jgi:hypothetical protein
MGLSDVYGMREQMGDAALYFDPSSLPEIARVLEMLWTMTPSAEISPGGA